MEVLTCLIDINETSHLIVRSSSHVYDCVMKVFHPRRSSIAVAVTCLVVFSFGYFVTVKHTASRAGESVRVASCWGEIVRTRGRNVAAGVS